MLVPKHEPCLYCPAEQLAAEHVLHEYPLEVPEHDPERYCPPAQLAFEHVLQE